MSEREFIELLNLYLDHEIEAADAARLEAEVRSNPERRRTYLQYCRMQKACALLAEDFASERVPARPVSMASGFGWAAAGFASFGVVAAGLAVAFVLWQRPPGTASDEPTLAQSPALVSETPAVSSGPRRGLVAASEQTSPARLVLTGEPLGLAGGLRLRSAVDASPPVRSGDEFDWLRNFRVAGVAEADAAATLHFNHSAQAVRPEARHLGLKAQAEAAEMTAFRFSK